jgi:ParB family chromosome partitioning protein
MALGKGLGAILEEVGLAYEEQIEESQSFSKYSEQYKVEVLDVESITPNPYQPRKHFDENALEELGQSIQKHGLLQPIVVIESEGKYLLVAGERRLRAHKLAKIDKIKAIIADYDIDSIRLRELALVENIQREDLNPIELANSYSELIDVHKITHEELSNIVHKSRSQITNTMRLLTLSEYTKAKMSDGKISQGHAKVLVGLNHKEERVIVDTILGQKLTVRETENIIKKYKSKDLKKIKKIKKNDEWLSRYNSELKTLLPFKYNIKSNRLDISFKDEQEVQRFIEIIKNT